MLIIEEDVKNFDENKVFKGTSHQFKNKISILEINMGEREEKIHVQLFTLFSQMLFSTLRLRWERRRKRS